MPLQPFFNEYGMMIETLYSLVAIASCFIIYFKTKDLYELTAHRGIRYFRNTFLFFGFASLIRFVFHALPRFMARGPEFFSFGMFEIVFSISIYLSCVAFFYLLLSILWRKLSKSLLKKEYLIHIFALIITLMGMIRMFPSMFILFQLVLFALLAYVLYFAWKERKKLNKLYVIYLMMFGLMIMSNVLEFLSFFTPLIAFMIYCVSIPLFIIVLMKVLADLNPEK